MVSSAGKVTNVKFFFKYLRYSPSACFVGQAYSFNNFLSLFFFFDVIEKKHFFSSNDNIKVFFLILGKSINLFFKNKFKGKSLLNFKKKLFFLTK